MDFLTQFEQAVLTNEDNTLKVLSQLPTTADLLKVLLKTKQYNKLNLLMPLVRECDYRLVAKIIVKGNLDLNSFVKKQLKGIMPFMFYEYGKRGLSIDLIPQAYIHYGDGGMYTEGLIKGDHVNLLRPYFHMSLLGKHCSKKCIDKAGYSKDYVYEYVDGALAAKNADTIQFLKTRDVDLSEVLLPLLKDMYMFGWSKHETNIIEDLNFLTKQGVKFNSDLLDWLSEVYPKVYATLQEQV